MALASRLSDRLDAAGISQSELARRVGLRQSTINALVKGNARSSAHLHKIARELGTTPEYLDGETDDPSPANGNRSRLSVSLSAPDDDVEIDATDLAYGMGGAFLDTDDAEVEKAKFSRTWLRQFTASPPEMLFSALGIGDSMWPTIHDRDVVIADRSSRTVDQADKIWAVVYGGVGMIKRLRPLPDGTVRIMSDNPQVSDELATDGDLHIVGRVAAIVRRV